MNHMKKMTLFLSMAFLLSSPFASAAQQGRASAWHSAWLLHLGTICISVSMSGLAALWILQQENARAPEAAEVRIADLERRVGVVERRPSRPDMPAVREARPIAINTHGNDTVSAFERRITALEQRMQAAETRSIKADMTNEQYEKFFIDILGNGTQDRPGRLAPLVAGNPRLIDALVTHQPFLDRLTQNEFLQNSVAERLAPILCLQGGLLSVDACRAMSQAAAEILALRLIDTENLESAVKTNFKSWSQRRNRAKEKLTILMSAQQSNASTSIQRGDDEKKA